MLATRYTLLAPRLRSYFYSGWAFLIPYLAVYLLYYVTKWPVNAAVSAEGIVKGISNASTALTPSLPHSLIPCMLHVYWVLHAIHVILAGFALWSWWKLRTSDLVTEGDELRHRGHGEETTKSQITIDHEKAQHGTKGSEDFLQEEPGEARPLNVKRSALSVERSPLGAPYSLPATRHSLLTALAPWLLLALLFYIPGVYLEWPSDPWEHLRRINEWRILDTVGAHSSWIKSAYFIPYSLLSWCIGLRQLFWLDFYYTGICLLLCWQYYRLSRTCGLGERSSMVFVIIQALLFGNNIFSFYRYYGISSSIYAQIGAVALVRAAIDCSSMLNFKRTAVSWSPLMAFSPACALLLLFITFQHRQGLAISGLGMLAVALWKAMVVKPSVVVWGLAAILAINLVFLLTYHRSAEIEKYAALGYLNGWYGFNLLDLTSAAGDRLLQISSLVGVLSALAAVYLIAKNQVVGWMTLTPTVVLLMPCITVPFTEYMVHGGEIYAFHRLLLAAPCGMALVAVGAQGFGWMDRNPRLLNMAAQAVLLLGLICCMSFSPGKPLYNRLWNVTAQTPGDLALSSLVTALTRGSVSAAQGAAPSKILATPDIGFVALALSQPTTQEAIRSLGTPAPTATYILKLLIDYEGIGTATLTLPDPLLNYTPFSTAAVLSGHWLPTDVTVICAGRRELLADSQKHNWVAISPAPSPLFRKRNP